MLRLDRGPDHSHRHLPVGRSPRSAPRTGPEFAEGQKAGLVSSRSRHRWALLGTNLLPGGHLDLLSHPGHALRANPNCSPWGRDGPLPPMFASRQPTNDTGQQHHRGDDRVSILAGVIPSGQPGRHGVDRHAAAFIVVSVGVIILRVREPDLPRVQSARLPRHPGPVRPGLPLHPGASTGTRGWHFGC